MEQALDNFVVGLILLIAKITHLDPFQIGMIFLFLSFFIFDMSIMGSRWGNLRDYLSVGRISRATPPKLLSNSLGLVLFLVTISLGVRAIALDMVPH